jgi:toxin-antitoxin system PIN domain toxin
VALIYLPDINFWMALNYSSNPFTGAAKLWFDALPPGARCDFCRYTQMGFLRLSSNAKVNPTQTRTLAQAWLAYDAILTDPRVGFTPEPAGLETHWRGFTQQNRFSPNVWNDAYLAAFAIAGGYELVTFDQGFAQYPGLRYTLLT